jgi:hypothetical protein
MNIKSYRSFIREKKREVNKSTKGVKVDNLFEKKVNFLLEGQITTLEFETYLESELYLNVNETYLINESLASNFADKVISKIKSLFNNLYQKLKEDSGFQMIISFFDKVVSGISKFWNFLKKIKAGKLLKKLSITLGITSLASYILAQFGAGWVALMGARMVAATVGKKVGDKVVGESFNIKLYEEFILSKDYYNKSTDNIQEIDEFYTKNYTVVDSYYDQIFRNSGSGELYNEFKSRWSQLKVDRKRYKTAFLEFFNWVVNNQIVKKSKSTIELESLKWKKKNQSKVEIIEKFELLLGVSAKTGLNKEKENVINDIEKKLDGDNKETIEKDKIDNEPIKDDPIDNNKKSIWSKIGGSISKFFKIFRKLKWAIVIFFGVVFILNLIFFPIFEPILQIAQVSSFGTILSDAFEQTANSISSIPNTTTDGVKLNLNVENKLSDNTEVGKNIQGTIDEVKGNIKGNEKLAAEEADDIVKKAFNETRTGSINLSELDDEMFNKLPNSFVAAESIDLSYVHNLKEFRTRNIIANVVTDSDNYSVSISGSVDYLYEFKTFTYKQSDGATVYKIIAVKRDSINGEVSEEKWNEVLGRKNTEPSKEVEQKGKFWKNLKDKTKGVLNITDDDKYVKELEKNIEKASEIIKNQGFENSAGSYPIEKNIYDLVKDRKISPEDLEKLKDINSKDFYSSVSKIKQNGLVTLQNKLTEQGIKPNSNYMVFKELDNGNIQWFYLIPKK